MPPYRCTAPAPALYAAIASGVELNCLSSPDSIRAAPSTACDGSSASTPRPAAGLGLRCIHPRAPARLRLREARYGLSHLRLIGSQARELSTQVGKGSLDQAGAVQTGRRIGTPEHVRDAEVLLGAGHDRVAGGVRTGAAAVERVQLAGEVGTAGAAGATGLRGTDTELRLDL